MDGTAGDPRRPGGPRREGWILAGLLVVAGALFVLGQPAFPSGTASVPRTARALSWLLAMAVVALGTRAVGRTRPPADEAVDTGGVAPLGPLDGLLVAGVGLTGTVYQLARRAGGRLESDEATSMPQPDWDLVDFLVSDVGLPGVVHNLIRAGVWATTADTGTLIGIHLLAWWAFAVAVTLALRGFVDRTSAAAVLVSLATLGSYLERVAELRAYATFLPMAALATWGMSPGARARWPWADAVVFGAGAVASLDNPLAILLVVGHAAGRHLDAAWRGRDDPAARALTRWTLRLVVVLGPAVLGATGFHAAEPPVAPPDGTGFAAGVLPWILVAPWLPLGPGSAGARGAFGLSLLGFWVAVRLGVLPDQPKTLLLFSPLWIAVAMRALAAGWRAAPEHEVLGRPWPVVAWGISEGLFRGGASALAPVGLAIVGIGGVVRYVADGPWRVRGGRALVQAGLAALVLALAWDRVGPFRDLVAGAEHGTRSAREVHAHVTAQPAPPPVFFEEIAVHVPFATSNAPALAAGAMAGVRDVDLRVDGPYVWDRYARCGAGEPAWFVVVGERDAPDPCPSCVLRFESTPSPSGRTLRLMDCTPGAPTGGR